MFEERRSHDPRPDEYESEWMHTNPLHIAARVLVLVALAVSIGTAVSQLTHTQSGAVVAKAR
jgi:hypothetical protein